MTQPIVIAVEHWDGQRHVLNGRVAWMAAFLIAHLERVNDAPSGSLTFGWNGSDLKPELHIHYPRVNTAA